MLRDGGGGGTPYMIWEKEEKTMGSGGGVHKSRSRKGERD